MLRIPQKYEPILRVDGVEPEFLLVHDDVNVSSTLSSVQCLNLVRTVGRLWLLYGFRKILRSRKRIY